MTDLETIAALQKNDQSVFDEVYYIYHKRIYHYILGKTHSSFMAEEVTQITFIKLWQHRASLSLQYSLFTQLFTFATTSMIDLLRKESSLRKYSQTLETPSAHDDTWEDLKGKELQQSVDDFIRQMPEMRRKVFEMSRYKGMTYRQIAEDLSLSVKTIESHMMQAIRQLRSFLGLGAILLLLRNFFF